MAGDDFETIGQRHGMTKQGAEQRFKSALGLTRARLRARLRQNDEAESLREDGPDVLQKAKADAMQWMEKNDPSRLKNLEANAFAYPHGTFLMDIPLGVLKQGNVVSQSYVEAAAKEKAVAPVDIDVTADYTGGKTVEFVVGDGNRRVAAAKQRGDKTIKAFVTPWDDRAMDALRTVATAQPLRLNSARVQTETPQFKRWFGDWQAAADLSIGSEPVSVDHARSVLEKIAGRDITNLETGIVAQINSEQRNKILSNPALAKSKANGFTAQQHNAAAAKIAALWKHATPLTQNADASGDANIAAIKRFVAPLRSGNEVLLAYLTAKESVEHGHRVYSLELTEIEKLRNKGGTPFGDTTSAAFDETMHRVMQKVNPEAVSKVVNAQGRPLVVYHGTNQWQHPGGRLGDFSVFERDKSKIMGGKPGFDAVGSWFSSTPVGASLYGNTLYPVYLSIKNPLKLTFDQFLKMGQKGDPNWTSKNMTAGGWNPDGLRQELKSKGYDGIVFPASENIDGKAHDVYVALEPTQIKSAIGNKGDFDPKNPSILASAPAYTPGDDEATRQALDALAKSKGLDAAALEAAYNKAITESHSNRTVGNPKLANPAGPDDATRSVLHSVDEQRRNDMERETHRKSACPRRRRIRRVQHPPECLPSRLGFECLRHVEVHGRRLCVRVDLVEAEKPGLVFHRPDYDYGRTVGALNVRQVGHARPLADKLLQAGQHDRPLLADLLLGLFQQQSQTSTPVGLRGGHTDVQFSRDVP